MMGKREILSLALFWALLFMSSQGNATLIESDKQALLEFLKKLPHLRTINWDESLSVCKNWTGITCNGDGTRVTELRLPGVGFHGPIPNNTLGRLSALQILSLRSNAINGIFPPDLADLKNLSCLYLQHNNFSGSLPGNFSVWGNLTSIDLSNNRFGGTISNSFSGLNRLTTLNLANNSISGEIPELDLPRLQVLNLSHNGLTGLVPKSLQRFPKDVFLGNNVSFLDYPPPRRNLKTKKILLWILAALCTGLTILGLGCTFLVRCTMRRPSTFEKGGVSLSKEKAITRGEDSKNSLVFFEGCNYAFDLEDLLRASAEVLGKGTFGMAYKAILEDSTTVVVKRLKDVSVGLKEFQQQMDVVGGVRHENVVQLRAYYYSKEEKLIVCDYFGQGSVAAMLHGSRGGNTTPLDWETRVRIAIGASRGIARIHQENGGKLVHGNIKSSNIFLNSNNLGCVSDAGLSAMMDPLPPPLARAAGYRAPEVTDTRKATQPSDVFSFGVLLLELLTGKSPVHATGGDEIVHLVRWVHSVVREEWTAEVFDVDLLKFVNIEEEMVEMLQIALSCVVRVPHQRPTMAEVVAMVEGIPRKKVDLVNRQSSETATSATSESDY